MKLVRFGNREAKIPQGIENLTLFPCSDEAGFVLASFYPIAGGFLTLNS